MLLEKLDLCHERHTYPQRKGIQDSHQVHSDVILEKLVVATADKEPIPPGPWQWKWQ